MTGFGTFKAKVSRKLRTFPKHARKIVFTHARIAELCTPDSALFQGFAATK